MAARADDEVEDRGGGGRRCGITKKQSPSSSTLAQMAYKEAKNGSRSRASGSSSSAATRPASAATRRTARRSRIPARKRLKFVVAKAAKDGVLGASSGLSLPGQGRGRCFRALSFSNGRQRGSGSVRGRLEAVLERVLVVVRALAADGAASGRALPSPRSLAPAGGRARQPRARRAARRAWSGFGRALTTAPSAATPQRAAPAPSWRAPPSLRCGFPRPRRRSASPPTSAATCAPSTECALAPRPPRHPRVHVFLRATPHRARRAGEPLPGRGGRGRGGDHLRSSSRRGGGGRRRTPRARRLPWRHRRPRAADGPRLPAVLPRHPARARRPGAHAAGPPRPALRVRGTPVRHPGRRRRSPPRHDPPRAARGEPPEAGRADPRRRGDRRRSGLLPGSFLRPRRRRLRPRPSSSTRRAPPASRRACC